MIFSMAIKCSIEGERLIGSLRLNYFVSDLLNLFNRLQDKKKDVMDTESWLI